MAHRAQHDGGVALHFRHSEHARYRHQILKGPQKAAAHLDDLQLGGVRATAGLNKQKRGALIKGPSHLARVPRPEAGYSGERLLQLLMAGARPDTLTWRRFNPEPWARRERPKHVGTVRGELKRDQCIATEERDGWNGQEQDANIWFEHGRTHSNRTTSVASQRCGGKHAKTLLQPLTAEEQRIVAQAIGTASDDEHEVVARHDTTKTVTRRSICLLPADQWLNDEIINMCAYLLAQRDEAMADRYPGWKRNLFVNSHFYDALLQVRHPEKWGQCCYENVQRWFDGSRRTPGACHKQVAGGLDAARNTH